MQKTKELFLSQPHQPFFTLAIINAIIMMTIFMLSMGGYITLSINPLEFHSYSLIFLVFTPAFLGFLLTTYPRFSQVGAIDQKEYLKVFYPLFGATWLFLAGSFGLVYLLYIAKLLIIFSQTYAFFIFYNIYNASPSSDKHDQFWIATGWAFGIVANLISFFTLNIFSEVGVFNYLIFVAMTVALRMVPFFSHVMKERDEKLMKNIFIIFIVIMLLNIFAPLLSPMALIVSGVLLLREMIRLKLPNSLKEPILWILHLALYWLPLALILGGILGIAQNIFHQNFLSIHIHLVVLGFLTTIFVGFGTRVTLGHSGNQMYVDRYTKIVFYLTQIVLYFRVLYSFNQNSIIFNLTASLWIAMFVAWGVKYLPVLVYQKKLR